MDNTESSFPPGTRVRIVNVDEGDACYGNPWYIGAVGTVGEEGLTPSCGAPLDTVGGAINLDVPGCGYFFAARVVNADSLVGRRYVDLTASEMSCLPVGTVLRDTGPTFNDTPIGPCTLGKDFVWRFEDGSECENWDGFEVVSFVPVVSE